MPTGTFTDAKLTNLDQEGIDVLFSYTVDDSTESQTIHVLGSQDYCFTYRQLYSYF